LNSSSSSSSGDTIKANINCIRDLEVIGEDVLNGKNINQFTYPVEKWNPNHHGIGKVCVIYHPKHKSQLHGLSTTTNRIIESLTGSEETSGGAGIPLYWKPGPHCDYPALLSHINHRRNHIGCQYQLKLIVLNDSCPNLPVYTYLASNAGFFVLVETHQIIPAVMVQATTCVVHRCLFNEANKLLKWVATDESQLSRAGFFRVLCKYNSDDTTAVVFSKTPNSRITWY
jgi:hypothetical protein